MTVLEPKRPPARFGVTGHRALPEARTFLSNVIRAVGAASAPGPATVVSALAEGADRLVARLVLDRRGELEVVLPRAAADYETDFADAASRAEFQALMARARSIEVAASDGTRTGGYEAAGIAMLDRVDRLVALWDGQPSRGRGGTAEIVAWARARGMPVYWVLTAAPYTLHGLDGGST